jgi:hypothetical protein
MAKMEWVSFGLVGFVSLLAACGGSSASSGSDSGPSEDGRASADAGTKSDVGERADAPRDAHSKDGASADGSTPEGSASSCASPDAGSEPYMGVVILSYASLPMPTFDALGLFQATPKTPPSECPGTKVGSCCYTPPASSLPTFEPAGNITVADGSTTLVTMMPPGYTASSLSDATLQWKPGDTLTITASGGTVDAFTAMVTAPSHLVGLSPAFTAPLAVSLKSDLVVSWTPSSEPCAQISFGLSQGAGLATIGCVVDDSAGTLTVPSSLLVRFTGAAGSALIERIAGTPTYAKNAAVEVSASDRLVTTASYTP